jgi:hypothetical protein
MAADRWHAAMTRLKAHVSGKFERLVGRGVREVVGELSALVTTDSALTLAAIDAAVAERRGELATLTQQLAALEESMDDTKQLLTRVREISSATLDGIPELSRLLHATRTSEAYERAFTEPEPLVTVRIATYNRSGLLLDRAVASVLRQTYQNFEIIVVGDGCTDDTGERIEGLNDSRVKFVNLPYRYPYPEDVAKRWLVAGSPGMNVGSRLAAGSWIAPLDDDDEFEPDHIEVLLSKALAHRYELVYGRILQVRPVPSESYLHGTYPPELAEFGFQGAMYLTALRFFEFNTKSWMLDEPLDWNLCRRMLEAGARIGWCDRVVTRYYPSGLGVTTNGNTALSCPTTDV